MQCDQRQVKIRIQATPFAPLPDDGLQPGEGAVRPAQLQTEQQLQTGSNQRHNHPSDQVLLGDHFVILRENILGDKRVVMLVVSMSTVAVGRIVGMCCRGHEVWN